MLELTIPLLTFSLNALHGPFKNIPSLVAWSHTTLFYGLKVKIYQDIVVK